MARTQFRLQGGLGNQLFIYFGAALHALTWKKECIHFEISGLERAGTQRELYLDSFKLPMKYSTMYRNELRLFSKVKNFVGLIQPRVLSLFGRFQITEVGFDITYLTREFSEILGYFQSWKYFEIVCKDTSYSKEYLSIIPKSDWANKLKDEIQKSDPIICHIRRGDYVGLRTTFGLLSYEYYENAFKKLRGLGCSGPIWVFSDSPQMICREFLLRNSAVLIEEPKSLNALEVFAVMQSADCHVISNSTFAWWAAFSSGALNVVAPAVWFRNMKSPRDILPEHWHKENSSWV